MYSHHCLLPIHSFLILQFLFQILRQKNNKAMEYYTNYPIRVYPLAKAH